MSETARVRKDRALRERSPVMVFRSFMMKMQALIDGHWRAIWAMLLAWRQRICLARSAWKDSSLASRLFRIHNSVQYRRHGKTQCSIMFIEERRLSLPWKTLMPLAKKALLAFSILHFSQDWRGWVTTMLQDIWQRWLVGFAAAGPQYVSCLLLE